MNVSTKSVLEIPITIESKENILENILKYLEASSDQRLASRKKAIKPLTIFTPNPEIVTYARKDPVFKEIVRSGQINLPDGAGICWALKRLFGTTVSRISGVDFMLDLCETAAKKGFRAGLIGGKAGVALDAKECLEARYPGLKLEVLGEPEAKVVSSILYIVSGMKKNGNNTVQDTPSEREETKWYFSELVEQIRQKDVHILFIALGFPKQEYFIQNLKYQIQNTKYKIPIILMAVGGAFDYVSGRVPRAPAWMRERGLEWLYRLVREPWRLGRQVQAIEFFIRIFEEKHRNV